MDANRMNPVAPMIGWCSPAGAKGRLSILIFHRVLREADPLFPGEFDAQRFDTMLSWVTRLFNVLPLDVALQKARAGALPARAAAITFDDGYADNHDEALPILEKHGISATFFVATDFLDGGRMWNDTVIAAVRNAPASVIDLEPLGMGRVPVGSIAEKRAAIHALLPALKYLPDGERRARVAAIAELSGSELPDDLMMTSEQVRALRRRGMVLGAHTCSHPILASLGAAEARREIEAGRARLEEILGERVGLFAYPNGKPGKDYLPEHVDMIRDLGFDAAVSTAWGAMRRDSDPFQLPRFTPWDRTPLRFGYRMMRNLLSGREDRAGAHAA